MRFSLLASLLAFCLTLGLSGAAFAGPGLGDADGDGIDNFFDNCADIANVSQIDADFDGCGNICDGDFNQDGITNGADYGLFKIGFNANGGTGASGVTDMDGSGTTNGADFGFFKANLIQGTPGPSFNTFRSTPTPCP